MERDEDKSDVDLGADPRITSKVREHIIRDYEDTIFWKEARRRFVAFAKGLIATAAGIITFSELWRRVLTWIDTK